MKLSAAVITHNEERNIARALESLRCCDEIVVVDSGSTDRTVATARARGARVISTEWRGYAAQKNFAAECCQYDWILSLDADEALSEALEGEIWAWKQQETAHVAYTMPRLAQYLGRWILHSGWYPDRKIRLYNRTRARWVGEYVHESVAADGTVGAFEGDLLHFTCASLSEHLSTLDRYTSLAAQQLIACGRPVTRSRILLHPVWTFWKTYVFQRGFLDGPQGLSIARMAALYNYLKYAKARDLRGRL